uniref:Uncharacterized protein n=1 Tax=Ursus maritimus TaxID=29073 RepID=A0A452TRC2_URSMA
LQVNDVAQVDQGWRADEEELQHPVADVGDREGLVVAHVGAARLGRVTLEIGLLVAPHRLASQAQDEDAEDEKHRQPDLAHHGGVLLDLEGLQCLPVHGAWRGCRPPCPPDRIKGKTVWS